MQLPGGHPEEGAQQPRDRPGGRVGDDVSHGRRSACSRREVIPKNGCNYRVHPRGVGLKDDVSNAVVPHADAGGPPGERAQLPRAPPGGSG